MFQNLTEYRYKRTTKEAMGFYIAYLGIIIITSSLTSGILAALYRNTENNDFGVGIGTTVASLASAAVSILILRSKNLINNFLYITLAIFAGLLSLVGGGILGLLIPSYLTTLKPKR